MHVYSYLLSAAACLVSLASADFDPATVPLATRDNWCQNQITSCPLLCLDQSNSGIAANHCNPKTLAYDCVCSTGLIPNITQYSQTIPYYQCVQNQQNCIAACGIGGNACDTECNKQYKCGAQDPTRHNVTSSATTEAAAATSSGTVYSGLGADSGSGSSSTGGAVALVGQSTGLSLVVAAMAVGFVFGLN